MSLDKIRQLVSLASQSLEDNEKLAVPVLAAKAARYLQACPEDKTLGAMHRVLADLATHSTFMRKADFRSLYHKLYSNQTKVAEIFEQELSLPKPVQKQAMRHTEDTVVDAYQPADPILANALPSVFDRQLSVKMFSQAVANHAIKSVKSSLDGWGLKPSNLSVNEGNERFLVVKADYETPKGITSFYVPVEVRNQRVLEPVVMMGNTGPQNLNHSNIKEYVRAHAGDKLRIEGGVILQALANASTEKREVSDTELKVIAWRSKKQGQADFFQGNILGQKLEEPAKLDVQLPKLGGYETFESRLNTPQGVATWKFGEQTVKTGANYIARELLGMGYQNPQIIVAKTDDKSITYGVSLHSGRLAFSVPVKVANNKLQTPEIVICNGSIQSFDREGINSLAAESRNDLQVVAMASPQYALKPSDLINNIRQAISEGNHAKAEDALNVLANAGDAKAYATGFNLFKQALTGDLKPTESKCQHLHKSSSSTVSQYPICGQTGLPINKVYQDAKGNCLPLYRRGMDETYQGASFMNAKIFG